MKFVMKSYDRKLSTDGSVAATYNQTGTSCPTSCIFHPEPNEYAQDKQRQFGRITKCYTKKGRTAFHERVAGLVDALKLRKSVADFINLRVSLVGKYNKIAKRVKAVRWHVSGDVFSNDIPNVDYVNAQVWACEQMAKQGIHNLGYTHGWQYEELAPLRKYFMASCDTPAEVIQAKEKGWVCTLLVDKNNVPSSDDLGGSKLVICPNQLTQGRVKCAQCLLCAPDALPTFNQNRVIGFHYH